jgi:hypothetical protein
VPPQFVVPALHVQPPPLQIRFDVHATALAQVVPHFVASVDRL